jgi:hypothetical protein
MFDFVMNLARMAPSAITFNSIWMTALILLLVAVHLLPQELSAYARLNLWMRAYGPVTKPAIVLLPPLALFLASPLVPYLNALDQGLVLAGFVEYPVSTPYFYWLTFPNAMNYGLGALLSLSLSTTSVGAALTAAGILSWYFAYLNAMRAVELPLVKSTVIASALTVHNPFLEQFSHVYGHQPPWSGNSSYGMLGMALLALGASLIIRANTIGAAIVLPILVQVSPANAVVLLIIVLLATAQAFCQGARKQTYTLTASLVVSVGFGAYTALGVRKFRSTLGEVDVARLETYLTVWDSHRAPSRYFLPATLACLILATSALGLFLARYLGRSNISSAQTGVAAASLASLAPLAYWTVARIRWAVTGSSNYSELWLINEMPLRITTFSGYLLPIFLILSALQLQKFIRIPFSVRMNYPNSVRSSSAFGYVIAVFLLLISVLRQFDLATSWAGQYAVQTVQADSSSRNPFFAFRQSQELDISVAGVSLTAPGTSNVALQGLGLPIYLHTENGIDFVPYIPELADDVAQAIEELYGVDFASPSSETACGCVPNLDEIRIAWESRSVIEWVALSQKFGFRNVVTPDDWDLHLSATFRVPVDQTEQYGASGVVIFSVP